MIEGGNATVFVTDLGASIEFYTKVLGCTLRFRAGDFWAEVQAGKDLVIGLHPQSPSEPAPGTRGATQIGLLVDEPIEKVVATLAKRGCKFEGDIVDDDAVKLAYLNDPDGNRLYLCEVKKTPAE
jgi:catechol 2,3-dioxygenase-like lactoylglutathione lyase family enzyme